jgi:hypothetical protein
MGKKQDTLYAEKKRNEIYFVCSEQKIKANRTLGQYQKGAATPSIMALIIIDSHHKRARYNDTQ